MIGCKDRMIGWTDNEVRVFDLKMKLLADAASEPYTSTVLSVDRTVDRVKSSNVDIERLRLGKNIWDILREGAPKVERPPWLPVPRPIVPGKAYWAGYEVEVVEEDPELIDVIAA
jgi:hypothetical protein